MKKTFAICCAMLLLLTFCACREAVHLKYAGAPPAYEPVLDDFSKQIKMQLDLLAPDPEGIQYMIEFPAESNTPGYMGYAVADINGDDTPELLLLSNPEKPFLRALFTLKGDEPVLLDRYSDTSQVGAIAADGTICSAGTHIASTLVSYKLDAGATELTPLTAYNSSFREGNLVFSAGDEYDPQQAITEAQWNALEERYKNPPQPMQLNFIPVE